MAAFLLSDATAFALRVSFSRAIQQHVPAFFVHGPTAAPARSRLLDAAVGGLVDTVIGVIRIALWAAYLLLVLAVILLVLVLFASCAVAALVAIVVHLDRARASRSRRLAVLAFISLFLVTVAVALMVVVILAIVDGEE